MNRLIILPLGAMLCLAAAPAQRPSSPAHSGVATTGSRVVKTGIDVLEADRFRELAASAQRHNGRLRLGLLTNQCGVDANDRRTVDVLFHDAPQAVPGLTLTTLFSPEHGISGALDQSNIASSTDPATGLPIVSLYGSTEAARRPALDSLRQLDAVVIDLQDVGVRFYTYEAVVRYFLEAAAKTGTEVIVLDRPNPIGGALVQGPISDPGSESYVNSIPVPVRHGMTLGELARYDNQQLNLRAPLTVIAMQGWARGDWYDATGLLWINPSPNLHDLNQATLYPGVGLIETTNVSVGRGTDTPFELLGAPWIDARALALYLNHRRIPGVSFVPVNFTPEKPYPCAGQLCHGVNIVVTNRKLLDAPELGIELASALHQLYPDRFALQKMNTLLADRAVLDDLTAGKDPRQIAQSWHAQLLAFEQHRRSALIYPAPQK